MSQMKKKCSSCNEFKPVLGGKIKYKLFVCKLCLSRLEEVKDMLRDHHFPDAHVEKDAPVLLKRILKGLAKTDKWDDLKVCAHAEKKYDKHQGAMICEECGNEV